MHFFSKSSLSQSALIFLFQGSFSSINGAYMDLRMSIISGLELLITFLRQAPSKRMWAHEQAGFQVTVPQSQKTPCVLIDREGQSCHTGSSVHSEDKGLSSPMYLTAVLASGSRSSEHCWQGHQCGRNREKTAVWEAKQPPLTLVPFAPVTMFPAWLYSKPHSPMYLRKKVRGDKLGLEGDYKDASSYNMQLLPVSQLGHHSGFHCERDRLQVKRKEWQGHQGGSVS